MTANRSVSHPTRPGISHRLSVLPAGVPQLSPTEALAEIEARVPEMTTAGCLEALGATARLSAVLMARNVTLAAQESLRTPAPCPDLLDAKAAAQRLRLSLPSVYRLARTGTLPSIRIGSDLLRFSPIDVQSFIDGNRDSPDNHEDS